ncbi:unnamed protein product, partial [Ectocarpus fasciculatus]
ARPGQRRCWSLRRSHRRRNGDRLHRHFLWCCRGHGRGRGRGRGRGCGRECRRRRRRLRQAPPGVRLLPRCWLPLAAGHPRASAACASFSSPSQDCRPHHPRGTARPYRRRRHRHRRPSPLLLRPIQPCHRRRLYPSLSVPPGLRPRHLPPPPQHHIRVPPAPHPRGRLYRRRQTRTPPRRRRRRRRRRWRGRSR